MSHLSHIPDRVRAVVEEYCRERCAAAEAAAYERGRAAGRDDALQTIKALSAIAPGLMAPPPPVIPQTILSTPAPVGVEVAVTAVPDEAEAVLGTAGFQDALDDLFGDSRWNDLDRQELVRYVMLMVQEELAARGVDPSPVLSLVKTLAECGGGDEYERTLVSLTDPDLVRDAVNLSWEAVPLKNPRGNFRFMAENPETGRRLYGDKAIGVMQRANRDRYKFKPEEAQPFDEPDERTLVEHTEAFRKAKESLTELAETLRSGGSVRPGDLVDFQDRIGLLPVADLRALRRQLASSLTKRVRAGKTKADRVAGIRSAFDRLTAAAAAITKAALERAEADGIDVRPNPDAMETLVEGEIEMPLDGRTAETHLGVAGIPATPKEPGAAPEKPVKGEKGTERLPKVVPAAPVAEVYPVDPPAVAPLEASSKVAKPKPPAYGEHHSREQMAGGIVPRLNPAMKSGVSAAVLPTAPVVPGTRTVGEQAAKGEEHTWSGRSQSRNSATDTPDIPKKNPYPSLRWPEYGPTAGERAAIEDVLAGDRKAGETPLPKSDQDDEAFTRRFWHRERLRNADTAARERIRLAEVRGEQPDPNDFRIRAQYREFLAANPPTAGEQVDREFRRGGVTDPFEPGDQDDAAPDGWGAVEGLDPAEAAAMMQNAEAMHGTEERANRTRVFSERVRPYPPGRGQGGPHDPIRRTKTAIADALYDENGSEPFRDNRLEILDNNVASFVGDDQLRQYALDVLGRTANVLANSRDVRFGSADLNAQFGDVAKRAMDDLRRGGQLTSETQDAVAEIGRAYEPEFDTGHHADMQTPQGHLLHGLINFNDYTGEQNAYAANRRASQEAMRTSWHAGLENGLSSGMYKGQEQQYLADLMPLYMEPPIGGAAEWKADDAVAGMIARYQETQDPAILPVLADRYEELGVPPAMLQALREAPEFVMPGMWFVRPGRPAANLSVTAPSPATPSPSVISIRRPLKFRIHNTAQLSVPAQPSEPKQPKTPKPTVSAPAAEAQPAKAPEPTAEPSPTPAAEDDGWADVFADDAEPPVDDDPFIGWDTVTAPAAKPAADDYDDISLDQPAAKAAPVEDDDLDQWLDQPVAKPVAKAPEPTKAKPKPDGKLKEWDGSDPDAAKPAASLAPDATPASEATPEAPKSPAEKLLGKNWGDVPLLKGIPDEVLGKDGSTLGSASLNKWIQETEDLHRGRPSHDVWYEGFFAKILQAKLAQFADDPRLESLPANIIDANGYNTPEFENWKQSIWSPGDPSHWKVVAAVRDAAMAEHAYEKAMAAYEAEMAAPPSPLLDGMPATVIDPKTGEWSPEFEDWYDKAQKLHVNPDGSNKPTYEDFRKAVIPVENDALWRQKYGAAWEAFYGEPPPLMPWAKAQAASSPVAKKPVYDENGDFTPEFDQWMEQYKKDHPGYGATDDGIQEYKAAKYALFYNPFNEDGVYHAYDPSAPPPDAQPADEAPEESDKHPLLLHPLLAGMPANSVGPDGQFTSEFWNWYDKKAANVTEADAAAFNAAINGATAAIGLKSALKNPLLAGMPEYFVDSNGNYTQPFWDWYYPASTEHYQNTGSNDAFEKAVMAASSAQGKVYKAEAEIAKSDGVIAEAKKQLEQNKSHPNDLVGTDAYGMPKILLGIPNEVFDHKGYFSDEFIGWADQKKAALKAIYGYGPEYYDALAEITMAVGEMAQSEKPGLLAGMPANLLQGTGPALTPEAKEWLAAKEDSLSDYAEMQFFDAALAGALAKAKQKAKSQPVAPKAKAGSLPSGPITIKAKPTSATAASTTKLPAFPSTPNDIVEPGFPQSSDDLEVLSTSIGGSTGAIKVRDKKTGKTYALKQGSNAEHLISEYSANRAYAAAGVRVPRASLYRGGRRPAMLTEWLEGGHTYEAFLQSATPAEKARVDEEIRSAFAADALFSNWDVLGAGTTVNDNVMVGPDGHVYRIDVGGSFRQKATGQELKPLVAGTGVWEFRTMRNVQRHKSSAMFGSITDAELAEQVRSLLAVRDDIMQRVEDPADQAYLAGRFDWLEEWLADPSIIAKPSRGGMLLEREPNPDLPDVTRPPNQAVNTAMQSYTGGGYHTYNEWLRRNPHKAPSGHGAEGEIAGLLAHFDSTPAFDQPVVLHRYLKRVSPNSEKMIAEARAAMEQGVPWAMNGFVSGTTANYKLDDFYSPTGMTYIIEAIHGLDMNPSSHLPKEAEMLLRHRTAFQVIEVTDNRPSGGGVVIRVKQLPPGTHV